MCSPLKEQSILSFETIPNAFFQNYAPFFDLDFILYQAPQSIRCSCCSFTVDLALYVPSMQTVKIKGQTAFSVKSYLDLHQVQNATTVVKGAYRLTLPHDKIFNLLKLKAFADNKINIT